MLNNGNRGKNLTTIDRFHRFHHEFIDSSVVPPSVQLKTVHEIFYNNKKIKYIHRTNGKNNILRISYFCYQSEINKIHKKSNYRFIRNAL